MNEPKSELASCCNAIYLCRCTDVERGRAVKKCAGTEMKYLKHLQKDLKSEYLYSFLPVENAHIYQQNSFFANLK